MRYQRTAQRITSAVNCRPLKDWSGRTWAARCRLTMPALVPDQSGDANCNRTRQGCYATRTPPTSLACCPFGAGAASREPLAGTNKPSPRATVDGRPASTWCRGTHGIAGARRKAKMAENMKTLMIEKLNQAYTAEKLALENLPKLAQA